MTTQPDLREASSAHARPRVLSVGPDHTDPGGMATVEQQILAHTGAVADVRPVSTHVASSVLRRLFAFASGAGQVVRAMAGGRVDIVHLHVSCRGSIVRKGLLIYAARRFAVPVVLHCHGAEFGSDFERMPPLLQRAVRHAFRRASRVVVLGEMWRPVYAGRVGVDDDRVVVVPNAVELPPAVPVRSRSPLRLVFLGEYGKRKGSSDLIRAVARLPEDERARVRLTMAGHGDVAEAAALVGELGLREVVDVRGWLGPVERDALLAESSVLVLPSSHEGLPLAMLEAMAWGIVPVVTAVGGIPEVVLDGQNGLFVTHGDVAGIAAVIGRLVRDPELVDRLGVAARTTAEGYGIEQYVTRLADVWAAVV